jgi:hypothetical protein
MTTNYTEYFKKRMEQHDRAFKKLVEQIYIPKVSRKRNYRDAFNQEPAYTRFTDELERDTEINQNMNDT